MVVTLASITRSASAAKSEPRTLIENAPELTVPVYALPLMVKVTVSPSCTSPPTVPVMATVPAASVALMMSSAVIFGVSVMLSHIHI